MQPLKFNAVICATALVMVLILLSIHINYVVDRAAKRTAESVVLKFKQMSETTEKKLNSVKQAKLVSDEALNAIKKEKKNVEEDIVNAKTNMEVMAKEIEELRKVEVQKKEYENMVNVFARDQSDQALRALQWPGHGPEKGLYNFTVVTAMMDIGRGKWRRQHRSYTTYLTFMQPVLKLDVNFVVFADSKAVPFVRWMRRGRENRTVVIGQEFKDLPYYKLKDRMAKIMKTYEYQIDNELYRYQLAEALYPEYDILQLSKLYFMDRIVRENPFNSTYFMWLDGGYGHGKNVHPKDHIWRPKGVFEFPNQVTIMELKEGVKHYEPVKNKIHRMKIAVVAGLFFGAGGHVFKELYTMQKEEVKRWLAEGIVDDDQTMYMTLYYRKPQLFHLVKGSSFYDIFKLFHYNDTNES